MNSAEFIKYCVAEIKLAVERFGTHQYNDKGPGEVMPLKEIVSEFKSVSKDMAVASLIVLCGVSGLSVEPKYLVCDILHSLDDDEDYGFLYDDDLMDVSGF